MEAPERTRKLARDLRRRMSLPEVLLWKQLKGRQLDGLLFRKQHPVGPYVLDFYCAAARLCVEVDGYTHSTGRHIDGDPARDGWLLKQGIRTLRLSAELVLQSTDDAVLTIR